MADDTKNIIHIVRNALPAYIKYLLEDASDLERTSFFVSFPSRFVYYIINTPRGLFLQVRGSITSLRLAEKKQDDYDWHPFFIERKRELLYDDPLVFVRIRNVGQYIDKMMVVLLYTKVDMCPAHHNEGNPSNSECHCNICGLMFEYRNGKEDYITYSCDEDNCDIDLCSVCYAQQGSSYNPEHLLQQKRCCCQFVDITIEEE